MQHHVTSIIAHMAKSHRELARLLEAKRQSIMNMAQVIFALPSDGVNFPGTSAVSSNAMDVTKSVTSYLNSLAELEEAMADTLEIVVKELSEGEHEE